MMRDEEASPYREPSAQPAGPRRSRIFYGWYLVAAAVLISAAVAGVNNSSRIFIFPLSVDLGWSSFALAGAFSIGVLTNGLTQPVLGRLFDRWDSRKVILISVTVAGLATSGVGLTPVTGTLSSCTVSSSPPALGGGVIRSLGAAGRPLVPEASGIGAVAVDGYPYDGRHFFAVDCKLGPCLLRLERNSDGVGCHLAVAGAAIGLEVFAQLAFRNRTKARWRLGIAHGNADAGKRSS